MPDSYYGDPVTDHAVTSWRRWLRSHGVDDLCIPEPSRSMTIRDGDVITIANARGVLAEYRVVRLRGEERVRRVRPETYPD